MQRDKISNSNSTAIQEHTKCVFTYTPDVSEILSHMK